MYDGAPTVNVAPILNLQQSPTIRAMIFIFEPTLSGYITHIPLSIVFQLVDSARTITYSYRYRRQ